MPAKRAHGAPRPLRNQDRHVFIKGKVTVSFVAQDAYSEEETIAILAKAGFSREQALAAIAWARAQEDGV